MVAVSAGVVWAMVAALRLNCLGWTLWILGPCALTGVLAWWGANVTLVFVGALYTAGLSLILLTHRGRE